MTTKYNPSVGEFNHYIHTESKSQGAIQWVASTGYNSGDILAASNNTYLITSGACTTGVSAPSGTGTGIVNGTCILSYLEFGNSNEAVGIGNVMRCRPTDTGKPSKQCWGMALDFWSDPGSFPPYGGFQVPFELDAINGAKDCPPGAANGCNFMGFYMRTDGAFKNTVGLQLEGSNGVGGAYWGINIGKNFGTSRGLIEGSQGTIGIKQDGGTGTQQIGYQQTGTQTTAGFDISGTAPNSVRLHGTNTGAALQIDGSSLVGVQVDVTNVPSGFVVLGTGGSYGFRDASSSVYGMHLGGTYTNDAFRTSSGSTSANALHVSGTQSNAGLLLDSTVPTAVYLTGTGRTYDVLSTSTSQWGASFQGVYSTAAITTEAHTGTSVVGLRVKGSDLIQWNATGRYTVATLPACGAGTDGAMTIVTDATAPTYRGALVGGGAVKTPVFCDGTAWTSH
jgi:hypothetical protein